MMEEHPAYALARGVLLRPVRPPVWYVRDPSLVAFVQRVAPVLEARLASSTLVGFTGAVALCFYRSGLRLRFEGGRLAAADEWPRPDFRRADACFPGLTFLQLLLGHRSLEALEYAFPDCRVAGPDPAAMRLLLEALFPQLPSAVWPVG